MESLMPIMRAVTAMFLMSGTLGQAQTPAEIPLWPGGAPGSEGRAVEEQVAKSDNGELRVSGIHAPSLTPYLPSKETATGAAVLVIPGGGHRLLAITHEGYAVGAWLAERGVAAFVLKHRLANEEGSTYKIERESLADAERAIRTIRSRAREWNVNPAHVGALGFSAGGEIVALAAARPGTGDAGSSDPVERESAGLNFQALIYPGRAGNIWPTKSSPPAFLAASVDDRPDISEGLAEVYLRFKRAGVPAELHIYRSGGHGFGLRPANKRPFAQWIARFGEWMDDAGLLKTAQ
jgi:endo-1,4-beta-xylanase